jgi:hypothetical protein
LTSHQPGEFIKKILGVLWAWRCFRVILNGKSRQGSMPESLQGLIVEVDMGDFGIIRIQGGNVNGKSMILGGDFDTSGL